MVGALFHWELSPPNHQSSEFLRRESNMYGSDLLSNMVGGASPMNTLKF